MADSSYSGGGVGGSGATSLLDLITFWTEDRLYAVDDPVMISGSGDLFTCIQEHTSAVANQPGTEGGAAYWVQLLNALSTAQQAGIDAGNLTATNPVLGVKNVFPDASDGEVLWNDGGARGSNGDFKWNKTTGELYVPGSVKLDDFLKLRPLTVVPDAPDEGGILYVYADGGDPEELGLYCRLSTGGIFKICSELDV